MKKIYIIALCALSLLAISCGGGQTDESSDTENWRESVIENIDTDVSCLKETMKAYPEKLAVTENGFWGVFDDQIDRIKNKVNESEPYNVSSMQDFTFEGVCDELAKSAEVDTVYVKKLIDKILNNAVYETSRLAAEETAE